jgi:hypothetical protein
MASKRRAAAGRVACWEEDPGDPSRAPALSPIVVATPDPAAAPFPFKMAGAPPAAIVARPGTPTFLYYAAAGALRRTADFWGAVLPPGSKWRVGSVLPVDQDAGVDLNAYYTRGGAGDTAGLHFFHARVQDRVYFSGESPDVVCHEMGHAVLDAVRPQLFNAQSIEAAAFHESFGDISAMLTALQVPSLAAALVADTAGTLNRSSRLSRLAEQLGAAIRVGHPDAVDPDCLRNAANGFFYKDPETLPPMAPAAQLSSEPHAFSRVFTGGFLDVLAGIVRLVGKTMSPAVLAQAAHDAASILIGALLEAPVEPEYFTQVAAHMVHAGDRAPWRGKYRDAIASAFVRRGILSLADSTAISKTRKRTSGVDPGVDTRGRRHADLPLTTISAADYGLSRPTVRVHASGQRGARAAASYTDDLFQRGHIDPGGFVRDRLTLLHPFSFKTHVIVEARGALVIKRRTFDCGFDRRWVS